MLFGVRQLFVGMAGLSGCTLRMFLLECTLTASLGPHQAGGWPTAVTTSTVWAICVSSSNDCIGRCLISFFLRPDFYLLAWWPFGWPSPCVDKCKYLDLEWPFMTLIRTVSDLQTLLLEATLDVWPSASCNCLVTGQTQCMTGVHYSSIRDDYTSWLYRPGLL